MGEPSPKKAKTEAVETNSIFQRHAVCCVLDYGSQYTQLIARRVRENGVLSVLLPGDASMVRRLSVRLQRQGMRWLRDGCQLCACMHAAQARGKAGGLAAAVAASHVLPAAWGGCQLPLFFSAPVTRATGVDLPTAQRLSCLADQAEGSSQQACRLLFIAL